MAKVEVNGANQAELFHVLTEVTGVDGHEGPIRWNFEKFVIDLMVMLIAMRHKLWQKTSFD